MRWQINTSLTASPKKKPYVLAFGQEPRVGISSLPLAPELLDQISSEADLNKAFGLADDACLEDAVFDPTNTAKATEIEEEAAVVPQATGKAPAEAAPMVLPVCGKSDNVAEVCHECAQFASSMRLLVMTLTPRLRARVSLSWTARTCPIPSGGAAFSAVPHPPNGSC